MDKCQPKTEVKRIKRPKKIACINCGCMAEAGKQCHCGCTTNWRFDPYDGWFRQGITPEFIVEYED